MTLFGALPPSILPLLLSVKVKVCILGCVGVVGVVQHATSLCIIQNAVKRWHPFAAPRPPCLLAMLHILAPLPL